jgi:hypothetical protein
MFPLHQRSFLVNISFQTSYGGKVITINCLDDQGNNYQIPEDLVDDFYDLLGRIEDAEDDSEEKVVAEDNFTYEFNQYFAD